MIPASNNLIKLWTTLAFMRLARLSYQSQLSLAAIWVMDTQRLLLPYAPVNEALYNNYEVMKRQGRRLNRARVQVARDFQTRCFPNNGSFDIVSDAVMRVGEIRQFCQFPEVGHDLVEAAMSKLNLLARAYHRTQSVKLAHTIAALAGCEEI